MKDKSIATDWAKQILKENKWCILDTEATGLNQAEICQIGILTPELPEGWQTLVKPSTPISQKAIEIHGITNEGSILFWRIALRLEVWGYTNKTRLRGFQRVRAGGLRLCSRDFQSPGVSSKSGCSPNEAVENESTFDQIFLQLMRRIGDRDLIIYNADFDLSAIKNSLRVHGIQLAFPTSDRRQCRIFTNGGSIHCAMLW